MKQYTFKVVINEGNDENWEEIDGRPGCDEVLEHIKAELYHWTEDITLIKYEDVEE